MSRLGRVSVGGHNPVRIMGIINASPESFYKKSVRTEAEGIGSTAKQMEHDGADFIDVGGMSTAPYLKTIVTEKTEVERVTNAIRAIQKVSRLPISVDTCRASVAKAAFELGVEILNDVTGLQYDISMARVLEDYRPSVILCAYSKGSVLGNPVIQTKRLLRKSLSIAAKSRVPDNKIAVDPAIGFFRKKAEGLFFTKINSDWVKRDLTIIQNLQYIKIGYPLVISVSRKSFIGRILKQDDPDKRLAGSLAAETIAVLKGADVVRTHDVKASHDAVQIAGKLKNKKGL